MLLNSSNCFFNLKTLKNCRKFYLILWKLRHSRPRFINTSSKNECVLLLVKFHKVPLDMRSKRKTLLFWARIFTLLSDLDSAWTVSNLMVCCSSLKYNKHTRSGLRYAVIQDQMQPTDTSCHTAHIPNQKLSLKIQLVASLTVSFNWQIFSKVWILKKKRDTGEEM